MEKLKGILKKIFCLPPLPTVLIAVPAFIFVFVILGLGGHPLLAYISYGLSAYALIITEQRAEKPRGVTTRVLNIIRFSVIKPLS